VDGGSFCHGRKVVADGLGNGLVARSNHMATMAMINSVINFDHQAA
jgi:hypothetical protein